MGAAVCLEDALVHQTHSVFEVRTGMTDVNTAVEMLVDSEVGRFGADRDQKACETNQDAGKMHDCLFSSGFVEKRGMKKGCDMCNLTMTVEDRYVQVILVRRKEK
jgi:hypothetical protein